MIEFTKNFLFNTLGIYVKFFPEIMPHYCAQYIRLSAKSIFNIDYKPVDAWNYLYNTKVVEIKNDFYNYVHILNPDDSILCYNPKSKWNSKKNSQENIINVTHIVLFLGFKNGHYYFLHQFQGKRAIFIETEFYIFDLEPKYICKI